VREQVMVGRCPSLGDLVAASDGGLSPSHKAAMTEHLRQCAPCRERLQQANAFLEASADVADDASVASSGDVRESAVPASGVPAVGARARGVHADGVRASDSWASGLDVRSRAAAIQLPAVTVPGGNVVNFRGVSERAGNARAAMPVSFEDEVGADYDSDEKDAARNREFLRRLHKQKQTLIHQQPATTAWVRQWLPAAALIPLLILGLAVPRWQTVVRAEELLKLASNHERSLPADHARMLRIQLTPGIHALTTLVTSGARPVMPHVKPFHAVRRVVGGVVRDAGPVGAGASAEQAALAAVLSRHGFDLSQPLSIDSVRAWRASPGEKHDEVFITTETFMLRTTASVGALRGVELTVRRVDYHVVKLALALEGLGRLEIAEIEEATPRAVKAAPVTPIAPIASTATAPVAMSTVPAPVGRGVAMDAALSPVTTVMGKAPVSQPGLSRWLDRTFRASPERKTFVPTLQRLVGDVRQHLSELDTLARRYPEAEVEEQWSSADRAALRRRIEDGYRRVSRDLNELELRVSVLFGSRTRLFPVTEAPADWRERAAAALTHAEAMDGQVRDLLSYDDVPSTETRATGASQVPATFAALWDVVHAPAGGPASR
jgi:hypothetical protein